MAVFVLDVLAFVLVGFQLKWIVSVEQVGERYEEVAVVICVAVIVARIAWVTGAAAISR